MRPVGCELKEKLLTEMSQEYDDDGDEDDEWMRKIFTTIFVEI